MAAITQRAKADGSFSYTAQIKIRRGGKVVHSEAKTFRRKVWAEDWAKRRELELAHPGALARAQAPNESLRAVLEWYEKEFAGPSAWGRTKLASIKALQNMDIAEISAADLSVQALLDHVRKRRREGAGPATVLGDLTWLGVALRAAKSVKGLAIDPSVVSEATDAAHELRLVAKSRQRDRLPTYEELELLDAHFARSETRIGRQNSKIPMRQIMWFAIYSTRRQEEITQIARADDEAARQLGIVRDAKHPREKIGNHRQFRYTPAAWWIAQQQPAGPIAFPYDGKSIGARFTRACSLLGIEDLHFHDLRHEGTTRLFEAGLSIPAVASYTLHESWAVLKRYSHAVSGRRVFNAPFLPPEALTKPLGF